MQLRNIKKMIGYNVVAKDGEFGKVSDFLIDDQKWAVRYLVVDTGTWLPGQKVLLPPAVLDEPDWQGEYLPVELNKKEIKSSPPLKTDEPVSRQHEIQLHNYFGWLPYWDGRSFTVVPSQPMPQQAGDEATFGSTGDDAKEKEKHGDPHLRSARELFGYHLESKDGRVGKVTDLLVDDDQWIVRYAIVDTQEWLVSKLVLIATAWLDEVSWGGEYIKADLSRAKIENSPEYEPEEPLTRNYEGILHDHYGRAKYWP